MDNNGAPFSMFGHLPKEVDEHGADEIAALRAENANLRFAIDEISTLNEPGFSMWKRAHAESKRAALEGGQHAEVPVDG